ncbi:MAG TPA: tetratricopeptide repeat protein [Sphingomicrobium sp.]|nr:tetratricopeptide repeat protein [Sphingomicrobium sp.]
MNKPFDEQCPAADSRLRLRCLGRFQLDGPDGTEVTPRTRKARALLTYLALSKRLVSRDQLADLLWSGRAAEQARSSLRQAIFELRHLGEEQAPLVSLGREEITLDTRLIATDLARIKEAATADDVEQLEALLAASDTGLLTDLDGLDPEFDAWLQIERAHEPAQTLKAALAAAERCLSERGAVAAQAIVSQVQRLDPCNEEATRLALKIDHQTGDRGALHRHYELLIKRLREDYDAAPSSETQELFQQLASSPAKAIAPHARLADAPTPIEPPTVEAPGDAPRRNPARRALLAPLAALAAVALLLLGWWLPHPPVANPEQSPLIAVLPFEQQPAGDMFLAEGLWEDTRLALSQTRTLRVLGRATTLEMAKAERAPKAYRDRLGVDYVLEGTVRRQGDRVRVTASLTRTSDGVTIWNSSFAGRLGDPLALQAAVAAGIEGRLRGQLARGGGRIPEQIATTAEVYALYSEARSLLRSRRERAAQEAIPLLERALRLDRNFAPAWSMLGSANHFGRFSAQANADWRTEARANVRRALELAPRLAEAHAVSALIDGLGSPVAKRSLERAVAVDPGNSEAWNWLGIARDQQGDTDGAIRAYQRAVEIDPFLAPALDNLATILLDREDHDGFGRLLRRLARSEGGATLVTALQAQRWFREGDYSRAMQPLLQLHSRPGELDSFVLWNIEEGLLRLGYVDQTRLLFGRSDRFVTELRGQRLRREFEGGRIPNPREFWITPEIATVSGRAIVNRGRGAMLVDSYRRGFASRADFLTELATHSNAVIVVPSLAVALRSSGQAFEAEALLKATEDKAEIRVEQFPGKGEAIWNLARIRAAQGRESDGIGLISRAMDHGWLPDGFFYPLDIAEDPPFRGLRGDPRFERLRRRILAHIARERAELGPVRV